jgi:hypothetical protein
MSSNQNVPFYVPAAASILNGIVFAPFELVSTRSKSVDATTKSFRLLAEIARKEGVSALWKGSSWFISGNGISRGIWLSSYNRIRNKLQDRGYTADQSTAMAAYVSGAVTATLSNPVWTLKSFAQLPNYPGILYPPGTSFNRLIQGNIPGMELVQENRRMTFKPRVLMSGSLPAVSYIGIESTLQLFLYERLKLLYNQDPTQTVSAPVSGLIGGVSRAAMLPLTYPLHVVTLRYRENAKPTMTTVDGVKTMIESQNRQRFVEVLKGIYQQKAWYNGGLTYTARVVPQASVLFFFYEFFRQVLA